MAAASDLLKVSRPLSIAFQEKHHARVTFSFAASGQLEQQIRQGAPFDVYAPAARSFCESLQRDGYVEGEIRVYALGALVAWWGRGPALRSLGELTEERFGPIALANPRYAPYGKAAQEALQAAGLWDVLQPKLVYADSVSHAFQMAQTGNADVALVALALVAEEPAPRLLIEPGLHAPIEQAAVVLNGSSHKPLAKAFVEFLSSPEAQAILRRYGFREP